MEGYGASITVGPQIEGVYISGSVNAGFDSSMQYTGLSWSAGFSIIEDPKSKVKKWEAGLDALHDAYNNQDTGNQSGEYAGGEKGGWGSGSGGGHVNCGVG